MNKKILIGALLLFILPILTACGGGGDNLVVKDVWARPGIAGGNSAVFFTIDNQSAVSDNLVLAASDVANAVELHKTTMEDGVMKMTPQEFVPIPAEYTVMFAPGGLHVMLIGLVDDLSVGDTFQVTLEFENHAPVQLDVTVQEP
ncbi:copper chaperone PCu(A)C [bacterium]|nr:copper chaperone PCu(A)C [bacterium]